MKIKRFYLEITNACNLDCSFCTNEKGNEYLNIDTIENYLYQIKEYSDYVYLHVLGEPLLHNDLDTILSITDKLKLNVQLVTNGTLLNSNLFIFKHPSLRKLSISLHSITSQSINKNYFKTIEEIINEEKDVNIELRFYNHHNLSKDLKEFETKLIKEYNIDFTNKNNSYKLKDNVYLYYADFFKWPDINDEYIGDTGFCRGAIDQLAILHDSTVTLCCLDPKGHNKIGNLKSETLKNILESKNYKEIVDNIKNRKLSNELCKKCSYRLRFDDKHNSK